MQSSLTAKFASSSAGIPTSFAALSSLLRADFTTQWRNRKSAILVIIVPVIILISWKSFIEKLGDAFVLSNSITVGLNAIGLMGYTISIARDRDKGIFQRLRVAPVPSWSIMGSRLLVQLFMIILTTLCIFAAGSYFDKISLSPAGYALCLLVAIVGGTLYLGLGQIIVGLIKNAETVNSITRLVYFAFIMIGMLGLTGILGDVTEDIVKWSPYGTVQRILAASLKPSTWDAKTSLSLLVTAGYSAVFSVIGIRKFQWNTR
jgi:ABC-2 type transport system permease protein